MWPSVTSMIVPGWVFVLLAAVSADSGDVLYKKVGDDVILKPIPTSEPIVNIVWKRDGNLAAHWDAPDTEADVYVRGSLNISSGELTITELTKDDKGSYKAEINNMKAGSTNLIVLFPVPKPSVMKGCETGGAGCALLCSGNTTGAEPVNYKWNFGATERETSVSREGSSSFKDFSCEMQNPVSQESSDPVFNPFFKDSGESGETSGNVNISTGVTVFICLLSAVLLTVLIHRWKAGMWFFQKASMPWEADFWRKDTTPRDAAESNGTTSHQAREKTDEDTPMA
ncbi:carcinoembryonic antigen-related cell adhesion molecule 1-like isoform X2 [Cheilinus undulatus]|uniref:carcinoembryonic antigen-related cell adhesion molecule 1-like isoform X2 n=1 Tax=Cheilinus undulatus TaxID=241271 RepID=UPI001BD43AE5|nr:carcinoembryonic antigen-related cell adhesion molecule 1-like isoform X2 [Cheilinus undulatus]